MNNIKDKLGNRKEVRLGDIASGFDYGVGAEAIEFDGNNKYIRITDIEEKNGKFSPSKLTSPSFGVEERYMVKENDILLARTGASVGKSYLYNKEDGILYFAGFLIRINLNEGYSKYVYQYLQTDVYHNFVKVTSARSGQPGINSKEYGELKVPFYSEDMTYKVSNFLSSIDILIDKQEEYVKQLELYRKSKVYGIMKSNNLKKTRLSNILKERNELIVKGKLEHVSLTKEGVIPKSKRYFRDNLVTDDTIKKYKVTRINDIVYNPANLKFGVIGRNKYKEAIFSPIYVTYKVDKKYNPIYIEMILTNENFINYIRKYEQGTVYERMAVSSSDFLLGEIKVHTLEEQNKIACLSSSIDKLIGLNRNKLEQLKLKKKYYLSEIFG